MGYRDLDATTTSALNSIEYSAGEEPWNKVQDLQTFENKDTDVSEYLCNWRQWHGMYRTLPLNHATTNKLALWTVGRGFEAKENTKKILQRITGNGKDTFNSILYNAVRTYKIGGDFYAEIMRDRAGRLTNIKPLDPGTIKIVGKTNGMIKHYEQVMGKTYGEAMQSPALAKWNPEEMLHLSNMRIADEIHGIPSAEKLMQVAKMFHLTMNDLSVIFHRYVIPMIIWEVDSDDDAETAAFKAKTEAAWKNMENIYYPKGTASPDKMSIPQFSSLDPMPWLKWLQDHFVTSEGVPYVILGNSDEKSEATAKIIYLAFQQTIQYEQRYLMDQLKSQLGIEIELTFPASIDPAVLTDSRKNTGKGLGQLDPASNKDFGKDKAAKKQINDLDPAQGEEGTIA